MTIEQANQLEAIYDNIINKNIIFVGANTHSSYSNYNKETEYNFTYNNYYYDTDLLLVELNKIKFLKDYNAEFHIHHNRPDMGAEYCVYNNGVKVYSYNFDESYGNCKFNLNISENDIIYFTIKNTTSSVSAGWHDSFIFIM